MTAHIHSATHSPERPSHQQLPHMGFTSHAQAFGRKPNNQSELARVGANRRDSASCDETGRIIFSFFVHLSFVFCRYSSRLVLRIMTARTITNSHASSEV